MELGWRRHYFLWWGIFNKFSIILTIFHVRTPRKIKNLPGEKPQKNHGSEMSRENLRDSCWIHILASRYPQSYEIKSRKRLRWESWWRSMCVRNDAECEKILRFICLSAASLEMQRNLESQPENKVSCLRLRTSSLSRITILSDPEVIKIHWRRTSRKHSRLPPPNPTKVLVLVAELKSRLSHKNNDK